MGPSKITPGIRWTCSAVTILFLMIGSVKLSAALASERTPDSYMKSYGILKKKLTNPDIKSIHPQINKGSNVMVSVDIYVNTISQVSEINMDYQVDMYLRQRWEDSRLADETRNFSMTLDFSYLAKIWVPDLFFQNEKDAKTHLVTTPNFAFELEPSGYITYTQRLSLVLDCPMDLAKFPLDHQKCGLRIESFAYSIQDIQFKWNDGTDEPVALSEEITLPEYKIFDIKYNSGNVSYPPNVAVFNYLTATFFMRRNLNYYIVGTFIPGILTVILAWVSFWIDHKSAPARVSLSLLAVLTMTTQFAGIRNQLPKVAYIKAIDIWMTGCLSFVFLALIEYAVVNLVQQKEDVVASKEEARRREEAQSNPSPHAPLLREEMDDSRSCELVMVADVNGGHSVFPSKPRPVRLTQRSVSQLFWPKTNKGERVDLISRFGFPILYMLFNVGWWITYTQQEDDILTNA